jgi:hypothetical protein
MKIIISEDQQKVLLESKKIESVQNLVDMAVDDYVEGCSKASIFDNIQMALCKGFKNGTTEVKVTNVQIVTNKEKTDKVYAVKLKIITDQEWIKKDDLSKFETRLSILTSEIIGSTNYWFMIQKVEFKENENNN